DRLEEAQRAATGRGQAIPDRLPGDAPLFTVPGGFIQVLNRDLRAAGIPKRDEWGRTIDVHALRHSHASHLSAVGVAPRVAQASMRHSDLKLTMGVYTDETLLRVRDAQAALPALPVSRFRAVAPLAPTLAPTRCKPGQPLALPD